MRTTLRIDDDVLDSAREMAAAEGRTPGSVVSDLARRSLRPTPLRPGTGFPVLDVPDDAPAISPADVPLVVGEHVDRAAVRSHRA